MSKHKKRSSAIRLYTDGDFSAGHSIDLSDSQAHYLRSVMRLEVGDSVKVFNGRDGEWSAEVVDIKKKICTVRLGEQLRDQQQEPVDYGITLAFAPLKNTATTFLSEKATELGVSALQPVITQYTTSNRVNTDRLLSNAIEAAEQCERLSVPQVNEPQTLSQFIDNLPQDMMVAMADETGGGHHPKELFEETAQSRWALLIGPEGGFSPEEREVLFAHPKVRRLDLGPRILRAETAALAALTSFHVVTSWEGK